MGTYIRVKTSCLTPRRWECWMISGYKLKQYASLGVNKEADAC